MITAEALLRLIDAPHVLVVDCRFDLADPAYGRAAYAAGHIPGAQFAAVAEDLAAPHAPGTGRHPLPTPSAFAAVLGRWGLTDHTQVIAHDQGSGAWAARLWWMLRARGHGNVQVLDGGWAAWCAAGGRAATTQPVRAATRVETREFAGLMQAAEVEAQLADDRIVLVDARASDRFAGRNETIDPVAGHVPGALNMPYTGNLAADQRWLAPGALRERWSPVMEAAHGRPVVAMCGSGITACHNLLALQLAGHGDTRLFAGSWSEWIADPARPVATGEHV